MKDVAKITAAMLAANPDMPPERAHRKASEMGKGIVFVALGAFLILLGFGLAIAVLLITKASPSIPLIGLAALPALPGAYYLLAGGNLISRDAMQAAEQSGGVITRTAAKVLNRSRKATPVPPPDA
jgi:hypothetical protein